MYVNDSDEPRGTLAYVDNFPAEAAAELDALRARVAELEGLLKRARPRVESFAFTTKYEEEARAARELAREIRAGLAGGSAGSREDA